jgi:CheY-like chemotaxis protein
MNELLNVLLVEDSESDAALVVRTLRRAGYDVREERVETADGMRSALDRQLWDLVICDYHMPEFTAQAALALVQQTGLDLPFIVVSGAMGEDVAVAMMKAGAHDYLMKDKLARLAPAVARELRDAQTRRERKQAAEALSLRFAELEAVNRVSTVLRAAQTVKEMFPRLLDETLAVLNTDVGGIWLLDNPFHANTARGWFTDITLPSLDSGQGIVGHVFTTGEVYLVHEFITDPRTRDSVRTQVPAGWGGACVPIRTTEGMAGAMFVCVPLPRILSAEEVHLLTTLF